eukprot:TRINITY_DN10113_c0_g1_i1.p1 TRINITY_DN10113_c0_g1~~TRINITY_DN10113_c0_g1_i1.p1  ORF type:complete len:167 (+),score=23.06 TRINITY_DN10113_c0_g1_i1:310-810(+)
MAGATVTDFLVSSDNVQVIKDSFASHVAHDIPNIAMNLFMNLFKVVPEAKELISATKGDQGPHRQNQKLQMHANIVLKKVCNIAITLDDPVKVEEAQKALAILGSRHVGYGVKLKQAAKLRDAFMTTFSEVFGDAWEGKTATAWEAVYDSIEQMFVVGLVGLQSSQ